MSFTERVGKRAMPQTSSKRPSSVADIDFKIIAEENDFPFEQVDFVRLGSAHAIERGGNREDLARVLAVYVDMIESRYELDRPRSAITFVEKF
jgi:hypothetical protein